MRETDRQGSPWTIVLAGLAYGVIGIATALLARSSPTIAGRNLWRLAAWALSLGVFVAQLFFESRRGGQSAVAAAWRVAAAVALGALALAAAGPMRSHWNDAGRWRMALLSLVAWPLITGLPAFVVALIGGRVLRRQTR